MYFDNYLKSNQPNLAQKFDPSSVSIFHQQSMNNFQSMQHNQRPYFNARPGENPSLPNSALNKNLQDESRPYMTYQTGAGQNNTQKQQQYQPKNNVSFNTELPNSNYNRETTDFMKRRDSIQQNNFLRTNQQHSPSNNKSFMTENTMKGNLKTTINNQQRNPYLGQKNAGSSNNLSNLSINTFKQQDYSSVQPSGKQQKDLIQEKVTENTKYFSSSNNSQYGFNDSKLSSKPYASGFKTGVDNFEFETKKSNQPYLKYNQKQKPILDKDFMYNFQLKNISSDLNTFSKQNNQYDDCKYYTPSLSKQSSDKEDTSIIAKTGYSQMIDLRHNNPHLQRENNYTDREMYKSPSIDIILNGPLTKQNLKKRLQSLNDNNQSANSTIHQTSKAPQNDFKTFSQSYLPQNPDKLSKQNTKNYHALIQNLQKKFTDQKKSSQSFQVKEKTYITEISKRQQKIKRLQTIIDNNKETIQAMETTIKQLKRKNDDAKSSRQQFSMNNNTVSFGMIQDLKKENNSLKQQIKKQRKRSISIAQQSSQKQLNEKQQTKIRDLQRVLLQVNKQKQSILQQMTKLKQSNTSVQQNYIKQLKQHQKTRQQLHTLQLQLDQMGKNYNQRLQSYSQLKSLHSNLQQKYQGSLQRYLMQQDKFQRQKATLQDTIQQQNSSRQSLLQEVQKLKAKQQQYEDEITFKMMKIRTLEQKLAEKESQLIKTSNNNQQSLSQTAEQYLEQLKSTQQQLAKKQLANRQLSQKLLEKTINYESTMTANKQLQSKIQQLQCTISTLSTTISNYQGIKSQQQSLKKNTDSAQIKTLSSQSAKEFFQYKETLMLLELYHQKYLQIVALFNLNQSAQQKTNQSQSLSLTTMPHQKIDQLQCLSKSQPSKQYLTLYHSQVTDEVKKILKDMKKLLGVLKQCQDDAQLKNQRLYELDKTLKKQGVKINALIGQIHLKNMALLQINSMQVEKEVFRLNEKYQILHSVGLGDV